MNPPVVFLEDEPDERGYVACTVERGPTLVAIRFSPIGLRALVRRNGVNLRTFDEWHRHYPYSIDPEQVAEQVARQVEEHAALYVRALERIRAGNLHEGEAPETIAAAVLPHPEK